MFSNSKPRSETTPRATCRTLLIGAILLATAGMARATNVTVKIENLGAPGSVFLTPFWIGAHDGAFDTYDLGAMASAFPGLEQIAEDGNTGPLSARFAAEQGASGGVDATVPATGIGPPPFDPGEISMFTLNIGDPTVNRYFSYASMIVPSNDAFIANADPLAYPLFDVGGNFLGPVTIDIFGSDINDAGTEVNSETDVAFLGGPAGQTGPNMGATEGVPVFVHLGLNGSIGNPAGTPVNILGGTTASGATIDAVLGDFTRGGAIPVARITIVPEPSSIVLALTGVVGFVVVLRTRRKRTRA